MNVKLIRMWSGEDVVADLIKEDKDVIVIANPIVAIPAQQGQIGFAPWSPLLDGRDKELEITRKYIVNISDTQEEIVDQYKEMFAALSTPPSKKLIL